VQSFVEFYQSDKLHRAALTAVASQITGDQIAAMWDQFRLVDTEGNGVITKDQLTRAFAAAPPGHVKDITTWAEALFEELDSDGSGKLEFTEWVAAALRSSTEISDSAMLAAFRSIDVDNTGNISLHNLSRMIQVGNEELEDIMTRADLNGDGVIDFEEFKAVFRTVAPRIGQQAQAGEPPSPPPSPLGIPAAARKNTWVQCSATRRAGDSTPTFGHGRPVAAW
jgi:calcium-dependent protein kinase